MSLKSTVQNRKFEKLKTKNMTKERIDQFYAGNKFAVIGVSENKKKFGSVLYKELIKAGLDVTPVNPNLKEFEGKKCFPSVNELPEDIDAIVVSTKPKHTIKVVKDAEAKGIKQIWLQQGSEDEEIIEYVSDKDLNVIYKKCAIMFANPKGIHGFHAFLAKLFGAYPK
jgi:predicted CoA-binding protein